MRRAMPAGGRRADTAGLGRGLPQAPQVIAQRPASVRLTRSIAKPYKQLLKQQLAFGGYRIGELYPVAPGGPRP